MSEVSRTNTWAVLVTRTFLLLTFLVILLITESSGRQVILPSTHNVKRSPSLRFPNSGSRVSFSSFGSGVGGTGIPCDNPGHFVLAPDGCNRCYCELNSELSAACSKALCPPGFPSTA